MDLNVWKIWDCVEVVMRFGVLVVFVVLVCLMVIVVNGVNI